MSVRLRVFQGEFRSNEFALSVIQPIWAACHLESITILANQLTISSSLLKSIFNAGDTVVALQIYTDDGKPHYDLNDLITEICQTPRLKVLTLPWPTFTAPRRHDYYGRDAEETPKRLNLSQFGQLASYCTNLCTIEFRIHNSVISSFCQYRNGRYPQKWDISLPSKSSSNRRKIGTSMHNNPLKRPDF